MFNSSTKNFLLGSDRGKLRYFLAAWLLSLISSLLGIVAICLLIPLLSLLNNQTNFFLSDTLPMVRYLILISGRLVDTEELVLLIVGIACLAFLESWTRYLSQIVRIKQTKSLIYELKCQGFSGLCAADLNYFVENSLEDILFKINREIERIGIVVNNRQELIITAVSIIIFTVVLAIISLPLTLVAIALIGLMIALEQIIGNLIKTKVSLVAEKNRVYHRQIIEFLTGIYQIQQANNQTQEYQKITQLIRGKHQAEFNTQATSALVYPNNQISYIILVLSLILASQYLGFKQIQTTYSVLLVYILLLFKLLSLIRKINQARTQLNKHQSSIAVVKKFLARANQVPNSSGTNIFNNLISTLEFQDVTFAYPRHGKIILDQINFQLLPQETLAIIGASGAGKSTLVNLLLRFYEPIAGRILINDCELKTYELQSLRQKIKIINHQTFIFNNSLLYNLTYGLKNISEAEIMAAAKVTKFEQLIKQLPQGLSTIVGDNSDREPEPWQIASMGKSKRAILLNEEQKKLLAITRAILAQPEIIILDKARDNLAPTASKIVQEAITCLCRDRTTIIITEQLETIKQANRIIILNKGKIVESGTHQSLLKTSNLYQRLYSAQFKTSQESHQQQLAKQIAQKLARQNNNNLSYEIRNHLNTLLNYLKLLNDDLENDEQEQSKILDESYQSAKNMLASLREYERKINRGFKKPD